MNKNFISFFVLVILISSCVRNNVKYVVNYSIDSNMIESHGYLRDDLKEGEWKYYYKNGEIYSSGAYKSDKKIGYWEYYYGNGDKSRTVIFIDGIANGYISTYRLGRLLNKFYVRNGKAIGDIHFYKYKNDNYLPIDTFGYPVSNHNVKFDDENPPSPIP